MEKLIGEALMHSEPTCTIACIERKARLFGRKSFILQLEKCWLEDGEIDYAETKEVKLFRSLREALQYCCATEREVDYIASNVIAQLMRNHRSELIDRNGSHLDLEEDANPACGRMLFGRQDAPDHVHWVQVAPEVPPGGPGFGIWVEFTDGDACRVAIDATIEVDEPEPEPEPEPGQDN